MAHFISLPTFSDDRGHLTVCEKNIPFTIKRVFYVYGVGSDIVRGRHKNLGSQQVLVCVAGKCRIDIKQKDSSETFDLDEPDKALFIDANEWHAMHSFSPGAVLLVLASEYYDPDDYHWEV